VLKGVRIGSVDRLENDNNSHVTIATINFQFPINFNEGVNFKYFSGISLWPSMHTIGHALSLPDH
jgi:hypothetical protein